MKNSISKNSEALTPEVVLGVLRDSHLQQCQYDPEAESDVELSFESTVDEWRYACDLVSCKHLGRAMNKWFGTNYSDEQWHKVLEPAESKTLLGVCELISSKAKRHAVVPITIFCNNCLEAGAFVALRTALANTGVPVNSLKPSTKLDPWLVKYWGEFSDVVGKLAPEALLPVEIEESFFQKLSYWVFSSGIVLWVISVFIDHELISTTAGSLFISGFLLILITSRMKPNRVSFSNLETFGDACHLISKSVKSSSNA